MDLIGSKVFVLTIGRNRRFVIEKLSWNGFNLEQRVTFWLLS